MVKIKVMSLFSSPQGQGPHENNTTTASRVAIMFFRQHDLLPSLCGWRRLLCGERNWRVMIARSRATMRLLNTTSMMNGIRVRITQSQTI